MGFDYISNLLRYLLIMTDSEDKKWYDWSELFCGCSYSWSFYGSCLCCYGKRSKQKSIEIGNNNSNNNNDDDNIKRYSGNLLHNPTEDGGGDGENDSVDENENGENDNIAGMYPTKITSTLENCIEIWQQAITNYRQYEEFCFEEKYKDIATHIQLIRNDPDTVLNTPGYSIQMYELAKLRKLIYIAKNQLGLFDHLSSDKPIYINRSNGNFTVRNPLLGESSNSNSNSSSVPSANQSNSREDSVASSSTRSPSKHTSFGVEYIDLESTFSSRLSKTWAERLDEVIPTQGEISITPRSGLTMKLKPKWPDFLSNVTYNVIKRNRIGQRMHRLIRLTEYHLLNIKNGNSLSKVYLFNQIRRVTLEDYETVVLTLKSGKQLIFVSNLAPNIAQQLITRIKVRLQLDRIDFSPTSISGSSSSSLSSGLRLGSSTSGLGSNSSLGYSSALTATIIQNISIDTQDASDAMRAFAQELRDRTIRGYIASYNGRHNENLTIEDDSPIESSLIAWPSSTQSTIIDQSTAISIYNDNSISNYNESENNDNDNIVDPVARTLVELIEKVVENVEPSTSSSSVSSFPSYSEPALFSSQISMESSLSPIVISDSSNQSSSSLPPIKPGILKNKSPSAVRNMFAIVEGSNEYNVKCEVQKIIFDPDTPEGNTKNVFIEKFPQSIIDTNNFKTSLLDVRLFIDGMHGHILKKKGVELAQLLLPHDSVKEGKKMLLIDVISHPLSETMHSIHDRRKSIFEQKTIRELAKLDQNILSVLSFIIFTVVEEATFIPLRNDIIILLSSTITQNEEQELQIRRKVYSKRTQSEWGIPPNVVSPLNWKSAIFELSSLESNLTPSMMLHSLTRTAKAIYSEFKLAVVPLLDESSKVGAYLSADDFVPIFIYIFCQSDLSHAILNKDLMWNLCHPDQLHGEYGYYLTAYESAIEYIINETPSAEELAMMENLSGKSITSLRERSDSGDGGGVGVNGKYLMESNMETSSSSSSSVSLKSESNVKQEKKTPKNVRKSNIIQSIIGNRSTKELLRQSFT